MAALGATRVHGLRRASRRSARQAARADATVVTAADGGAAGASAPPAGQEPLLLRAVRGEKVERPPVWMMRQAGRYMKIYQDLCKRPGAETFRLRSETPELAIEVSLQPWKAFKPDGVILFSDILTPLAGMNIPFDILPGKGPVIADPIVTLGQVGNVTPLEPEESVPFTGEVLRALRSELNNEATLLGFVGAPFTLATYIVEGGMTTSFKKTKKLMFTEPQVMHALLDKLADGITTYARYQADNGAQLVQIFDSWANYLAPEDFDEFCLPYLRRIVSGVKATHPHVPLTVYCSGSGGLVERLQMTGADVISLAQDVDLKEARQRLGMEQAVQGNLDAGVLFGDRETIERRVLETIQKGGNHKHIMNLGAGVTFGTPEENVATFFETCRTAHERLEL